LEFLGLKFEDPLIKIADHESKISQKIFLSSLKTIEDNLDELIQGLLLNNLKNFTTDSTQSSSKKLEWLDSLPYLKNLFELGKILSNQN
jgi:hypothetical protein